MLLLLLTRAALAAALLRGAAAHWAGVGIADVTGPAADVNLMVSGGIHFRLRARAFVIGDDEDEKARVAFVSVDNGMGSMAVTRAVVDRLQARFPGQYSMRNVCISGTHTHSAPAGFLQNVLFQITSFGFVRETFEAYVDGIERAIVQAHKSAESGRKLTVIRGAMKPGVAGVNRSPSAYANNPKAEREQYAYNTDLNMTMLRIDDSDGTPVGVIDWFATHGTSMPNTNSLLSGDNKGYASQLFEAWLNGPEVPVGQGPFVAAFASTNLGDVSPNVNGTYCTDSGLPCEELHSTCAGRNEMCHGRGPSVDAFESTAIIGRRQALYARSLFYNKGQGYDDGEAGEMGGPALLRAAVSGPVRFAHTFLDMSNQTVTLADGTTAKTCKPSMGYSFAAGTTDGPGAFDFVQAETTTNPFWELVRNVIKKPSEELKHCHHPKPVLLPTGEISLPYAWDPVVQPIQIFQIGRQLAILSVPNEFTTMAGRRLRNAVRATLVERGALDPTEGVVVIAGLANDYTSYVTTFEEYQVQRYEGASTLYGPHTHAAYVQAMQDLAKRLADGTPVPPGPEPPNLLSEVIELLPQALPDSVASDAFYGKVRRDVEPAYDVAKNPETVVTCSFYSANPRHDQRLEGTYLAVERRHHSDDSWEEVATDADFDTRFIWQPTGLREGIVVVEWRPAESLRALRSGLFRITHYGKRKHWSGDLSSFVGRSSPFVLKVADNAQFEVVSDV